jgi:putative endonuclease
MFGWLKSLMTSGDEPRGGRDLAEHGENLAARHLRNQGLRILLRNFRCELGEIDIVARDGKTIVFVEVKTRENDSVAPESAVDSDKQQHIARVARFYLSRYGLPQPPHRFDIVAIVWPPGRKPQINHIRSAF